MQIFQCEGCGKRISDVDLEHGKALEHGGNVYCPACAELAGVAEAKRKEKRKGTSRAMPAAATSRRKTVGVERKGASGYYAAIGVAAAVIIIGGWLLLPKKHVQGRGRALPPPVERVAPAVETSRPPIPEPRVEARVPVPEAGRAEPEPAPKQPDPVPEARETVILEMDFEQDSRGWEIGRRAGGNVPDGSEWAFESLKESSDGFADRVLHAACYEYYPGRGRFFNYHGDEYLEFDYYATALGGDEPLQVQVYGKGEWSVLVRYNVDAPVPGKWTRLSIKLDSMRAIDGRKLAQQAAVTEVYIRGIASDKEKVSLLIDNLRFVRR
ncbi:MAG: hypothetical protein JW909_10830 [Planctomycetes bacterium]|nr:hypothetical protein [Planctomycetota bacterium]